MKIKFITCSGANETTDIVSLLALAEKFPIVEFGIQVSGEKCHYGSQRFKWINDLAGYAAQQKVVLNIALHVNRSWAEECGQGNITRALADLLDLKDCHGDFFAKRIQFNFKIGRDKAPDKAKLAALINSLKGRRCILSYNESNKDLIQTLYREGVVFDCLYDESFGEGIAPKDRKAPAFIEAVQGYAGGISPDNVRKTLNEIYQSWYASPNTAGIWLDAEGMLKGENKHLSLVKCCAYLENAMDWRYEHRIDF